MKPQSSPLTSCRALVKPGLSLLAGAGITLAAAAAPAVAPAPAAAPATARAEAYALRVPDHSLRIDGDDADWRAFGKAFDAVRCVPALPGNLDFANPDRGTWQGADDFSFAAWVAVDTEYLYVLAEVHDQLLFNDADLSEVYLGDDFEVFIDANPPAAQFAAQRNENARQFIFLPAWTNPAHPAGGVWKAAENPGVTMASRLLPWGYRIEVQIPKALFPNWKQNPSLAEVGFDVMLGDADSPGMDGPHGAIKYSGFLLSRGNHFQTSEKLGRLAFAAVAAVPSAGAVGKDPILRTGADLPARQAAVAERQAQALLDAVGSPGAATLAGAALGSGIPAGDQAALRILAKRPELPAPTAALLKRFAPTSDGSYPPAASANYALVALAERQQLPAKDWFDFYNRAPDPQLRLCWVWCCMANRDAAVVPQLQALLTDTNLRVRVKAAMALGQLGDAATIPVLEKMQKSDPHGYGRREAELSIAAIRKRLGG